MKETITLESEDFDSFNEFLNHLVSYWEGWSNMYDDDGSKAMKRGIDEIQELLGKLNEAREIE